MDTHFSLIRSGRLTQAQCNALAPLRGPHEREDDVFTTGGLTRLRFLRWLIQRRHWGGVADGAGPTGNGGAVRQERSMDDGIMRIHDCSDDL
jgi:hypothetical protein